MKYYNRKFVVVSLLLAVTLASCEAQIKNQKTATVKIFGNCGMCEKTIETAAYAKNSASADWDRNTKQALVKFDSTQTNLDEVLKRIALAGYDNEKYLAPEDTYSNLAECCQYDREAKSNNNELELVTVGNDANNSTSSTNTSSQLKAIFDRYFELKDALVNSDGTSASLKANLLVAAIKSVTMETLTTEEHVEWMKVKKDLMFDAEHIGETKDAGHQRDHFTSLSKNIYSLIKVSGYTEEVYYQHCPMFNKGKGADWLSKEGTIKNPYYGAAMLGCGKTTETIKRK
jgi:copper chaperone CopZ